MDKGITPTEASDVFEMLDILGDGSLTVGEFFGAFVFERPDKQGSGSDAPSVDYQAFDRMAKEAAESLDKDLDALGRGIRDASKEKEKEAADGVHKHGSADKYDGVASKDENAGKDIEGETHQETDNSDMAKEGEPKAQGEKQEDGTGVVVTEEEEGRVGKVDVVFQTEASHEDSTTGKES